MFAVLSLNACATETKNSANRAGLLTREYVWYDGDREQSVWLDPQLVVEFDPDSESEQAVKQANTSARVVPVERIQPGIRLWQIDNNADAAVAMLKSGHPQGRYSPVFHDGTSRDARMRALPGNIIVYLNPQWDEPAIHAWLTLHKLQVEKKLEIGPNIYVIKTGPGLEALDTANGLYRSGEVKAAFPDWWQEVVTR